MITIKPQIFRFVRERWYHRVLDRLVKRKDTGGVLVGQTTVNLYVDGKGRLLTQTGMSIKLTGATFYVAEERNR
jgi:hypothetical protein